MQVVNEKEAKILAAVAPVTADDWQDLANPMWSCVGIAYPDSRDPHRQRVAEMARRMLALPESGDAREAAILEAAALLTNYRPYRVSKMAQVIFDLTQ